MRRVEEPASHRQVVELAVAETGAAPFDVADGTGPGEFLEDWEAPFHHGPVERRVVGDDQVSARDQLRHAPVVADLSLDLVVADASQLHDLTRQGPAGILELVQLVDDPVDPAPEVVLEHHETEFDYQVGAL